MAAAEKTTGQTAARWRVETSDIPEPAAAVRRWRFNVEQYYRLAEAGILTRGDRVELIDGDILTKSPIGSRHAACVDRLIRLLQVGFLDRGIVRVQGPLRLGDRSEPEPDLLVLKPKTDFYASGHPGPADVFVLIEVMDTSADYDRNVKLGLYARSGLPEVWLVDLNREAIEVYRRPAGGAYTEIRDLPRGVWLAFEAFPDVVIGVDAVLG